jgi:hypothetical protein
MKLEELSKLVNYKFKTHKRGQCYKDLMKKLMNMQNQITEQLKSYDLKNADTINIVNDVLQCQRLMEPEMVDDFEVL